MDYQTYLEPVTQLARAAGEAIMAVYDTDFTVEHKADHSPLTQADKASHDLLVKGLQKLTPDWPVLSEEASDIPFAERQRWQYYWLVDPLDGTREFVKRNGEFTVNIALIKGQQAVLGVVYVPAQQTLYFAAAGGSAFKQLAGEEAKPIQVRPLPPGKLTVVGSRSFGSKKMQLFMECLGNNAELTNIGSALKICLVAEGKADLYPRLVPTSEWDTAAAQCIAEQAGAQLTDLNLKVFQYNTKESLINPFFIVFAEQSPLWLDCLQAIRDLSSN